jgi:hypothetical protein
MGEGQFPRFDDHVQAYGQNNLEIGADDDIEVELVGPDNRYEKEEDRQAQEGAVSGGWSQFSFLVF